MKKPDLLNKENIANAAAHAAQQMPQQPILDPKLLNDAEDMKCINQIPMLDENRQPIPDKFITCNGEIFVDAMKLKYINPILSPIGKQTVGAMMIGKICIVCGKIFNPDEWMKQRELKSNLKGGGE